MIANDIFAVDWEGRCWNCNNITFFLSDPSHSPYNGEANFTCSYCFEPEATVYDFQGESV